MRRLRKIKSGSLLELGWGRAAFTIDDTRYVDDLDKGDVVTVVSLVQEEKNVAIVLTTKGSLCRIYFNKNELVT